MEVVRNRSDKLLAAGTSALLPSLLKRVGYPVPSQLDRGLFARCHYAQGQFLAGRRVALVVPGSAASPPSTPLRSALEQQQATITQDVSACHGLLVDCSGVQDLASAEALFTATQQSVLNAPRNARVVLVGTDSSTLPCPVAAAFQEGLQGFTRSLAKEVGARGCTVNLLRLPGGTPPSTPLPLQGPLSFLLRPQAAFVTGQVLSLTRHVALPAGTSADPTQPQFHPAPALALPDGAEHGTTGGTSGGGTKTAVPSDGRTPLRFDATQQQGAGGRGVSDSGSGNAPLSLAGKVALVTGAARGIGAAIAWHLAASGAHVLAMDLPSQEVQLRQTVEGLPGGRGLLLTGDVTQQADVSALATTLGDLYGGVDVVVHNAGRTADKTLKRMSPAAVHDVLALNLAGIHSVDAALGITPDTLAAASAAHAVAGGGGSPPPPDSRAAHLDSGCLLRPGGRHVTLSSINGIAGAFGQTNYAFTVRFTPQRRPTAHHTATLTYTRRNPA